MSRFSVWNGVRIHPDWRTLGDIAGAIQGIRDQGLGIGGRSQSPTPNPRPPTPAEWLVKAGEGGTWQAAWDGHPLAIDGPEKLAALYREGLQLERPLRVTPYLVVRGRAEWREAEFQQIVRCAQATRRVVLNVEPGSAYWNGPTDQHQLQQEYLWPLEERLSREVHGAGVGVCMVPRPSAVRELGGVAALAAWLAFARWASWQCYDALADDLDVGVGLAWVDRWSRATGWGNGRRYRIPVVQQSRLAAWAGTRYGRHGLEVWHLDGD